MTYPSMRPVVLLPINAVGLTHARTQVASDRFNDDVKVVVHQRVSVAKPVVAHADFSQQVKPTLAICVVQEDVFASVATRGDVELGTGRPGISSLRTCSKSFEIVRSSGG